MNFSLISKVLSHIWVLHLLCCILALLSCIPLLWPETSAPFSLPIPVAHVGSLILGAILCSLLGMIISCVHFLLKLSNLKAIWQICSWGALWGASALVFVQMSIEANIPSPYQDKQTEPIQQSDTLHQPNEKLTGPASLIIPVDPEPYSDELLVNAPNLLKLEKEHEEILADFLNQSPRWAFADKSDTFYTRPGHVILAPPATGGIPGSVHAAFRTIAEGEPMPAGFRAVQPGAPFPESEDGKDDIPDIALELSGKHYLLLAWRGTKHRQTAHKAINAAIATIDDQLQRLAEEPTRQTIDLLCTGHLKHRGSAPELRLCEPSNQYGIYQAEVYANPGRAGTLLLVIRQQGNEGKMLRLFSFPARYSSNPEEIFRHDIPGAIEPWMRDATISETATLFHPRAPYFAIACGQSHHYFGVSVELQFSPSGSNGATTETLLRRHYKVQAYDNSPEN